MKKLTLLLTTLLIVAVSCNKIDTTKNVFTFLGSVEISPWDPEYANTVIQKIYVEEFTGHTCTYCPAAAQILKTMMEEDSTIISTSVHCTYLADPTKQPFDKNYKTPMGNIICDDFNIRGLPQAMVNRVRYNNSTEWGIARNLWRKAVNAIDRKNIRAGIELLCHVNETTQDIEVNVAVTIIKEIPNPVQICLVLQQDNIVSGQTDGNVIIDEYVHNHMLRAGLNGNYGTKLTHNGMVVAQTKYSTAFKLSYKNAFPYSNMPMVIENCSVVAYLLDVETKEVVQVECVHLSHK